MRKQLLTQVTVFKRLLLTSLLLLAVSFGAFAQNAAPVLGAAATVNVAENTTAVGTYIATDADGNAITYSVTGDDAALFNIGASSGLLNFISPPDFETPTDTGANNVYNVTVNATDVHASENIAVPGVNITTTIPSWLGKTEAQALAAITAGNIGTAGTNDYAVHPLNAENTNITLTFTENYTEGSFYFYNRISCCSDRIDGSTVEFKLAGVTQETLTLDDDNENAGSVIIVTPAASVVFDEVVLTFGAGTTNGAPNNGAQNFRGIEIYAKKEPLTATQAITVNVTNVVNESPVIITSSSVGTTLVENSGAGQTVYTAAASNSGGGTLSYAFAGGADDALLAIDSATGVVTLTADPDSDTKNLYSFAVEASNGTDTSAPVTVTFSISDLNDVTPTITSATAVSIDNGTAANTLVYVVGASDSDENTTLTYAISGTDAGSFTLNTNSGNITNNFTANFGTKSSYTFDVTASDGTNTSTAVTVTLSINDPSNNTPVITSGGTATAIDEGTGAGQVIYTVTATDADVADTVTYNLLTGADAADFTIDSSTGAVTLTADPDFETKTNYTFNVTATDGTSTTAALTVTLAINNLNDELPVLTSSSTATAIDENSGAGQVIYQATATDGDAGTTFTYSIGGTDAAAFSINSSTGAVTLTANPDAEVQSSYSFDVTVSDGTNTNIATTVSFMINDLNDNTPVVTAIQSFTYAENQTSGYAVGTVAATDADTDTSITGFTIASGNGDGFFAIDSAGEITLTAAGVAGAANDFETAPNSFTLGITATDGTNTSASENVTITVTNVNDTLSAPSLAITNDTGSSNSDGVTNDATITISGLEIGADYEFSRDGGTNWIPVGTASAASETFDGAAVVGPPGTLNGSPTLDATGLSNIPSLITYASNTPDTFFFDITTPTGSSAKEVLFESGGVGIGITIFRQGTDLKISIGNDNNESDLTATNVLQDNTRYAVIVELAANSIINYYVAEMSGSDLPSSFGSAVESSATNAWANNDWSGHDTGGWGQVSNDAQGTTANTYASFTGTFHEGRFYSEKGFSDIWTDGAAGTPLTSFTGTIIARQTDSGSNTTSADSAGLSITFETGEPVITTTLVASDIDENTDALGSVSADEAVTWSVSLAGVSISAGGVLTLDTPADFESGTTSYTFTVTATDTAGNQTTTSSITVNVNDVDDTAPVVNASQSFNYAENQASGYTVGMVTATDAGGVTGFTIASGNGDGFFAINASGNITLTAAGVAGAANDFETTPNSFTLGITATDGTNTSASENVTITVTDLDEVAPVFSSSASVNIGIGVDQAYDADASDNGGATDAGVTYTLSGANAGDFTIDAGTGVVTFNTTTTASGVYNITITASDAASPANTADLAVTINVLDQPTVTITDDVTASVTNGDVTFTFEFSENVSDFVAGDITVTNGTAGTFAGSGNMYTLVVTPTASSTGDITVAVANGAATGDTSGQGIASAQATQAYDTVAPTIITTLVASDIDENTNALGSVSSGETVTWSVSLAGVSISAGGVLTLDTPADFESGTTSYTFTVTATDTAGNQTATGSITVNVNDVSDTTILVTVDTTQSTDIIADVDVTSTGSLTLDTNAGIDGDVTIADGGTLTLVGTGTITGNVTITDGGSLIATDGAVTGTVTYQRNVPTTNWYLISSPVTGQDKDTFVGASNLATSGSNVGFSDYDNATGAWSYYQSGTIAGTTGNFVSGEGHAVKLNAAGSVSFSGSFNNADVSVAVSSGAANNFNLIGNPYLAYVSVVDMLNANTALLTGAAAEQTVWLWNQAANAYVEKNLATDLEVAPGQGFFVLTNAAGNFSITEAMQSHNATNTFQRVTRPEVALTLSNGELSRTADIFYINGATKGFNNGFDSSIFGGVANEFAVYTRAVANGNGRNLGIQSLPQGEYENMIIPVGVNAVAGSSLEFSARSANLPAGIHVYLEDKNTNTFTRIDNATYRVTTSKDLNGVGQFYIHTTSSVLAAPTNTLDNVSVYASNNETLKVEGITEGQAQVRMYSILGKQVINTTITGNGNNRVALPKLQTGVYLVEVQSALGTLNKKLIIE